MVDYLINFVNDLNPNGRTVEHWPQYTPSHPTLLTLVDGSQPLTTTDDTFRPDAMNILVDTALSFPL